MFQPIRYTLLICDSQYRTKMDVHKPMGRFYKLCLRECLWNWLRGDELFLHVYLYVGLSERITPLDRSCVHITDFVLHAFFVYILTHRFSQEHEHNKRHKKDVSVAIVVDSRCSFLSQLSEICKQVVRCSFVFFLPSASECSLLLFLT